MIAYVDSSILLRLLLNQPGKYKHFSNIDYAISSRLLKAECLRSLDRARHLNLLTENIYVQVIPEFYAILDYFELIEISHRVLDRVGASFPVALGTLDAIHLSSAILWQENTGKTLVFLTHDTVLARAALASGFKVEG